MKVLIVDANDAMRSVMRAFLPESADDIRECADGKSALACYRSFMPDWVLMDWGAGRTGGLEATRRILAIFPTARILLITQHDDPELYTEADDAGAVALILKDELSKLRSIMSPQK